MLISKFDTANVEVFIKEFEAKYSINIPAQYKKFLLKYNGGETPETEFKLNKVFSDLRAIYGFGDLDYYSYKSLEKAYKFEEWISDNMLPIGSNDFGDEIMLGIGKKNNGKIYFYYHDRPKKYIEIAEDFKSFVEKCKSKKIGHIRTIEERRTRLIANGNKSDITAGLIEVWQEEIDSYANMHQEELILD